MLFKRSKSTDYPSRIRSNSLDSPSRAFSYYKAQDYNQARSAASSRNIAGKSASKERNNHWFKKIPSVLAVCLILFCVVYELMLSTNPKIIVLGEQTILQKSFMQTNTTYQFAAQKLFNDSAENRNKITINTSAIESQMQKEFPELSSVSIALPILGHRPILYLIPAEPALVLQSESSSLFLIDSNGKVLTNASKIPKNEIAKLPIIIDQAGLNIYSGQTILSQSEINFIQLIETQFMTHNIAIQSLVLPAASLELDVHIVNIPYFVKFNLDDSADANQQIGTFLATRKYLAEHSIVPAQYIDVRVTGRVFYK